MGIEAVRVSAARQPSVRASTRTRTQKWAAKIAPYDGFVFVTAEYNHGIPAVLKNAIDFIEQLRLVMAEVQVATVRAQVALSLFTDFENFSKFNPGPHHVPSLDAMLDHRRWSNALAPLRAPILRVATS